MVVGCASLRPPYAYARATVENRGHGPPRSPFRLPRFLSAPGEVQLEEREVGQVDVAVAVQVRVDARRAARGRTRTFRHAAGESDLPSARQGVAVASILSRLGPQNRLGAMATAARVVKAFNSG